ncbi:MAG TPA: hypothetical protein VEX13_07295 [Chloroflexia bacterium]|nr:hypothetical protein [Chloroflexia bacterium]
MLLVAASIFVATPVELVLEGHTKDTLQLIPFVMCGVGLLTVVAALVRPQKATLLALRVAMLLVALGGVLGIGLHLLNNFAFEREVRPSAAVGDVLINTLKGANPLLAPGILVVAALVAVAATYYHPALGRQEQAEPLSKPQLR